jgi:hypothetical protein
MQAHDQGLKQGQEDKAVKPKIDVSLLDSTVTIPF